MSCGDNVREVVSVEIGRGVLNTILTVTYVYIIGASVADRLKWCSRGAGEK